MLAVHDEIDGDLPRGRISLANRVGPHHRLLGGLELVEAVERQRPRQGVDIDSTGNDRDFHVRVGEITGCEGVEARAAENDADHMWRDLLGAHDLEGVQRATRHLNPPNVGS